MTKKKIGRPRKPRIFWLSNAPWANTGYGSQTRLFTPRIQELGYRVDIGAFYGQEGSRGRWKGMDVYPKMHHGYGVDIAQIWPQRLESDVLITLIDAWVMDGSTFSAQGHWAPWFPVDTEPLAQKVQQQIEMADSPIVYSLKARELCEAANISPFYVPHGYDGDTFYPIDEEARLAARRKLWPQWPEDAFVYGFIAANKGTPPRKSWDKHMFALAKLMEEDPNVYGYAHTTAGPAMSGVDLPVMCGHYGVDPERMRFCDQPTFASGMFSDAEMRGLYNSIDVLVNVSMGEGFGIPILEAQACGTPVLVGDWTSMSELCFAGAAIPKKEAEPMLMPVGGYQFSPHQMAVLKGMRGMKAQHDSLPGREAIAKTVLAYDADAVTEKYWRPVLAEIMERVHRKPEPVVSV